MRSEPFDEIVTSTESESGNQKVTSLVNEPQIERVTSLQNKPFDQKETRKKTKRRLIAAKTKVKGKDYERRTTKGTR